MSWFVFVILGIEAAVFLFFIAVLIVKIRERIKEWKTDKYKNVNL